MPSTIKPSQELLQEIQTYGLTTPRDALIPTKRDAEIIDGFNALSRENKEKLFQSRTPPIPTYIYKYFPSPLCFKDNTEILKRKEWLEKILINHELYLSSHTQFNDPFDVFPSYKTDATGKEIHSSITGSFQRLQNLRGNKLKAAVNKRLKEVLVNREQFISETIISLRKTMEKMGIFCFTTNAENILMWSHYAFNHQGICVEFDLTEELHLSNLLFKVEYSNSRPQINPMIKVQSNDFDLNLLQKAESWRYEDEWRLITGRQCGLSVPFGDNFLKSVIIGAKASEETRNYILEINKKRMEKRLPQLKIKQAQLCPTEYRIIT
ncbi:hypothetical protein C2134_03005 [Chromobacterium sinusclupearum]|uniref:DUF2971 domain-containing protein n=1 Tax=Chromobacterium sinusclupearum TaxID=2077146 RepID=A0A2K4MT24_9NEIS|nr:DUF2971 domain-containing protein [Chromobacterium sinusclupearum]POB00178.1 hypothetical protein C2134_03005 [Chromobacterium sinusclupearum]